jgi:NAD(P)-dependent dehydrogenase (short-subunit alcohol dehydrogenase family)
MAGLFDVTGKTALVTGGSRGTGLMIARGLVQAGARVIVSSRKEADVRGAAQELSRLGERANLEGGKRTSTLVAVTPCRVASVEADQLERTALSELAEGHRREDERRRTRG